MEGLSCGQRFMHFNDIIMSVMASEITSVSIVCSTAQIKENIKALRHWPLGGESTGHRWIPLTKDQLTGKSFHWMTSSCVSYLNSLWPSDTIWWHESRSTLALVMACCLMAPSHYLNQCWLIISEVIWLTPEENFTGNGQNIYILKITFLRLQPYLPGTNELIIKKFYVISCYAGPCYDGPEIILDMVSANEGQLYIVTLPFIGWTHAQKWSPWTQMYSIWSLRHVVPKYETISITCILFFIWSSGVCRFAWCWNKGGTAKHWYNCMDE